MQISLKMEDSGSHNNSSDPDDSPTQDKHGFGPIKREKTAAEIRKSNKPLMEKKRRERINTCLDQLKSILMDVTHKKESSYYSKLEKADILEMTVKYLKNMKRQQMAVALANDPSVLSKYIAGFNECSAEVSKYLNQVDGLTPDARTRLLSHLAGVLQRNSTSLAAQSAPALSQQPILAIAGSSQQVAAVATAGAAAGMQIPTATSLATLPGSLVLNTNTHQTVGAAGGAAGSLQTLPTPAQPMQLVPARLPSGEMVFLLTNTNQPLQVSPSGGRSMNLMTHVPMSGASASSQIQIVGSATSTLQAQTHVNLNLFHQHGASAAAGVFMSSAAACTSNTVTTDSSTSSKSSPPSTHTSSRSSIKMEESSHSSSGLTSATSGIESTSPSSLCAAAQENSPPSGNTSGSSGPLNSPLSSPQLSSTPIRTKQTTDIGPPIKFELSTPASIRNTDRSPTDQSEPLSLKVRDNEQSEPLSLKIRDSEPESDWAKTKLPHQSMAGQERLFSQLMKDDERTSNLPIREQDRVSQERYRLFPIHPYPMNFPPPSAALGRAPPDNNNNVPDVGQQDEGGQGHGAGQGAGQEDDPMWRPW